MFTSIGVDGFQTTLNYMHCDNVFEIFFIHYLFGLLLCLFELYFIIFCFIFIMFYILSLKIMAIEMFEIYDQNG